MRKKKMGVILLLSLLLAVTIGTTSFAAEADSAGNLFTSEDNLLVPAGNYFSMFAFGKTVDVKGSQAVGSVLSAGETVEIADTTIGESSYVAGSNVKVENVNVTGNHFSAGKEVSFSGQANGVYMTGEKIAFDGTANSLAIQGKEVSVKGTINGNVRINAGTVVIDPETVITGTLKIESKTEPEIPASAAISNYEFEQEKEDEAKEEDKKAPNPIVGKIKSTIYWMIAMSLFGLILLKLFPKQLAEARESFGENETAAVGRGAIGWFCAPIIAILMCCTVILAPAGIILLLIYIAFNCAATAFAGASLAKRILPDMKDYLAVVIIICALEILRKIPLVGWLVGIAADVYLFGYVVKCLFPKKEQTESIPPADVTTKEM